MPPEQWQDFHGEILTGLHSIMLKLDYMFVNDYGENISCFLLMEKIQLVSIVFYKKIRWNKLKADKGD